jgi:hypothetical protein
MFSFRLFSSDADVLNWESRAEEGKKRGQRAAVRWAFQLEGLLPLTRLLEISN